MQSPFRGQPEQLVVGHRRPEEVGQPGRQLVIADAIRLVRPADRLEPVEELRARRGSALNASWTARRTAGPRRRPRPTPLLRAAGRRRRRPRRRRGTGRARPRRPGAGTRGRRTARGSRGRAPGASPPVAGPGAKSAWRASGSESSWSTRYSATWSALANSAGPSDRTDASLSKPDGPGRVGREQLLDDRPGVDVVERLERIAAERDAEQVGERVPILGAREPARAGCRPGRGCEVDERPAVPVDQASAAGRRSAASRPRGASRRPRPSGPPSPRAGRRRAPRPSPANRERSSPASGAFPAWQPKQRAARIGRTSARKRALGRRRRHHRQRRSPAH